MLVGRQHVRAPYQDESIANDYIDSRYTRSPFHQALHERQARIVEKIFSGSKAKRLLEIAPGPARLTIYASASEFVCGLEQSAAMLPLAKARLSQSGIETWKLIQGDAFHLPFENAQFDYVMCFKLIRHFPASDRAELLAEIRRVLLPGGRFLLDVVNQAENHWLHTKWGIQANEKWIDDHWFTEGAFREEMRREGFSVERLHSVHPALHLQYYVWNYVSPRAPWIARLASRTLEVITAKDPLEWIAVCRCE